MNYQSPKWNRNVDLPFLHIAEAFLTLAEPFLSLADAFLKVAE